jgi:hypothetical protein
LHPSSGSKGKGSKTPAEAGDKSRLTFDPEDGGDIFLRNCKRTEKSVLLGSSSPTLGVYF